MSSATRSETALIRPFSQIDQAETPLERIRLIVGEAEYEPGAVVLSSEELNTVSMKLRLPSAQEIRAAVDQTLVPAVDCGLVVIATARSHRASVVLVQEYLKPESWPSELLFDRSEDDLVLNDPAGFAITVAIVLLHDLTAEPLRPHMAGTWLAKREFSISPERQDTSFSPEELTDDLRQFHKLPVGTLRFIHIGDWQNADVLTDEVHVYLDTEVLNLLLANPTDLSAVQMQIELAIQATETVAVAIARELTSDGSEPSVNSLDSYEAAKRFFENLATILESSLADILSAAVGEPARLRASLEAAFHMQAATTAALKEK